MEIEAQEGLKITMQRKDHKLSSRGDRDWRITN